MQCNHETVKSSNERSAAKLQMNNKEYPSRKSNTVFRSSAMVVVPLMISSILPTHSRTSISTMPNGRVLPDRRLATATPARLSTSRRIFPRVRGIPITTSAPMSMTVLSSVPELVRRGRNQSTMCNSLTSRRLRHRRRQLSMSLHLSQRFRCSFLQDLFEQE